MFISDLAETLFHKNVLNGQIQGYFSYLISSLSWPWKAFAGTYQSLSLKQSKMVWGYFPFHCLCNQATKHAISPNSALFVFSLAQTFDKAVCQHQDLWQSTWQACKSYLRSKTSTVWAAVFASCYMSTEYCIPVGVLQLTDVQLYVIVLITLLSACICTLAASVEWHRSAVCSLLTVSSLSHGQKLSWTLKCIGVFSFLWTTLLL